ncbi:MAG TPA: GAF domain-containing protein, partial [Anaerolineales bacterium]|nr:GAF domain-containing protein [Anaerolineales bacterium]
MTDAKKKEARKRSNGSPPKLRQQAEASLRDNPRGEEKVKSDLLEDKDTLLHELNVHQIELEMQNEELRQAQAELGEARDRYADLYHSAPVGYLTLNKKGTILEANLTATQMLGETHSGLLRQPFSRFLAKAEATEEEVVVVKGYYHFLKKLYATHSQQSVELRLMSAVGRVLEVRLDGSAPDGENVQLAMSDITERNRELRRARAEEQKNRYLAETLRASAQALAQTLDMDIVLRTLLQQARSVVKADTASVSLLDGETLTMQAAAGYERWTDPKQIQSIKLSARASPLFQKLVSTRRGILIPDITMQPDGLAYPGTELIRNYLLLPIILDGRVAGVVALGRVETEAFTEEHLQWAEALVNQAAVAIQNSRLFQQVQEGREQLQLLSRRLVEIQETERRFISRELHDRAGQALTSLILGLAMLEKKADDPAYIQARTSELKVMADNVLEELHDLAVNLRPASLDQLGLVAALEQLIKSLTQNPGPQI